MGPGRRSSAPLKKSARHGWIACVVTERVSIGPPVLTPTLGVHPSNCQAASAAGPFPVPGRALHRGRARERIANRVRIGSGRFQKEGGPRRPATRRRRPQQRQATLLRRLLIVVPWHQSVKYVPRFLPRSRPSIQAGLPPLRAVLSPAPSPPARSTAPLETMKEKARGAESSIAVGRWPRSIHIPRPGHRARRFAGNASEQPFRSRRGSAADELADPVGLSMSELGPKAKYSTTRE